MRMCCPLPTAAFRRQVRASQGPSQAPADSSRSRAVGLGTMAASAGTQTYSAWAPKVAPVNPQTWSPARKVFTSAPTSSISPDSSFPRIGNLGLTRPLQNRAIQGSPFRKPQSVRFTVAATTRISTSLVFGEGLGTSARRRTSGGPYLS